MFSEEKLSQAGQKNNIRKSFYPNTSYGFEDQKNCINKLSIKMFLKRKARKAYTYRLLLSFETSVTFLVKASLTSRRKTVSVVKRLSSDITQSFAGYARY